jgi:hypothetical protein
MRRKLRQRRLICATCNQPIFSDDDLFAARAGAVAALCNVVVQEVDDVEEVVWVPGWVCEECARRDHSALR